MKRFIMFLLCCCLLLTLLAACASDEAPSDAGTEPSADASDVSSQPEEADHVHISYKGLKTRSFTLEDMAAAEGREPDFSVEQSGTTIYIYNDVTLDGLEFTQVQYTYNETNNRISCTYSADSGLEEVEAQYRAAMTGLYGEPYESSGTSVSYRWQDDQENYVLLTQLNDTTLQLVFYLCGEAA